MTALGDRIESSINKTGQGVGPEIGEKCLSFDMYGRQVALTFQGNDKFRTKIGAFTTLFVVLALVAFATYRLLDNKDRLVFDYFKIHKDGLDTLLRNMGEDT